MADVVTCGGPKKSRNTSSILQIIFSCRSFEVSEDIRINQKIIIDSFEELGEFMNNKIFHGTLTKLSQAIGPYLGAIGPFVAFGLTFADTESPELRAIKA